jgi:hypothetical protein
VAESWNLDGEYFAVCNCRVSPCPCTTAGGDPTEGECRGFNVFSVGQGSYGDVDLSGLNFGLVVHWAGNILAGNWDLGVMIDQSASDQQAEAIETILTGKAGGTFGELSPLIGNYLGAQRASISYDGGTEGEGGSASVDGSQISYTALKSTTGARTELHHGALAFRDLIYPGKAQGHFDVLGISADANYGEWSRFEFSGP